MIEAAIAFGLLLFSTFALSLCLVWAYRYVGCHLASALGTRRAVTSLLPAAGGDPVRNVKLHVVEAARWWGLPLEEGSVTVCPAPEPACATEGLGEEGDLFSVRTDFGRHVHGPVPIVVYSVGDRAERP